MSLGLSKVVPLDIVIYLGLKWADDFIDNSSNLPSVAVSKGVINNFHIPVKAVHNNDTFRWSYQRNVVIKISTKFGQILNCGMYQSMNSRQGSLIINYYLIEKVLGRLFWYFAFNINSICPLIVLIIHKSISIDKILPKPPKYLMYTIVSEILHPTFNRWHDLHG